MILPGKLCVGILEEDNPLKSYYRFRPLLIREEEGYIPFTEHDKYPEDGCIRIVPDKNESGRFKQRMRGSGLFALVDLTAHPVENDKIRANKNYRGDGVEHNAYIIYSDVVQSAPAAAFYQIIDVENEAALASLKLTMPHAERVLARIGGEIDSQWYSCAIPAEDAPEASPLVASGEQVGDYRIFETIGFKGEKLCFALIAEKLKPAAEPAPAAPRPAPEPAPVQPAPARPAPAPQEKPWIRRDPQLIPAQPDEHLSPIQQILAQQSGLNPRKGKSLVELIDEKWAHSRMTQLGQPTDIATEKPVASPIDQAVEAVRAAWSNPGTQKPLLEALSGIEEFGLTLTELRQILSKQKINEELENLETQKIAVERDLQYLRENRAEMRKQMKICIRREDAAELADLEKAVESARGVLEAEKAKLAEAQKASKAAQDALEALSDGRLEARLRDFAVNSHIMDLLAHIQREPDETDIEEDIEEAVEYAEIDLETFTDRVLALALAKGWAMDRVQAANLCVCFAISPVTIFSGAPGTGKTALAKLLAEALGWSMDYDEDLDEPQLLLKDDCNAYEDPDPLDGWIGLDSPSRACLTVRDSGEPLSADLLDKGFMIRLSLPDEDAAWSVPAAGEMPEAQGAALLEGIRAFAPEAESVTQLQKERMTALRKWLAGYGVRLSHRALNDTFRYCALMNAYAEEKQVFDLAVAQRILPAVLASAPVALLKGIRDNLQDLPACMALMQSTPPIRI